MLSILLRKAAIQSQRSAHGWARPDVPLMIPYNERRKVDIFDTNMWFYCNVMPEYFINQNEAYLKNAGGALKQILIDGRYIAAALLFVTFLQEVLMESKVYGVYPDHFSQQGHTYPKKVQVERPFMKKHFLGLSTTPESGVVHMTAGDKTYFQEYSEAFDNQRKLINQLNEEGKSYIARVEKECKEKVIRRRSGESGESNGHHH